ncbi:hypothetical protein HYX16_03945 [Candidatus Woesearchaeota archaeon]|nr:hypothetical protein [Candidatus Woesearchaeota archaeon]
MVKKTRIMIIFAIILILLFSVLFIFRSSKNKEFSIFNDDETEFNPESDIYSNSFSIAILVDEKKTKEFDIENVNKDNKKKFDISLREKIIELLGTPLPKLSRKVISSEEWTNIGKGLKREKYEEVIEKKVEKEKYEEVKFYLFTSNITVAAAYLLIPKNVTFPAPAIIAMHQHGGGEKYGTEELVGKIGDENMFYAKEL